MSKYISKYSSWALIIGSAEGIGAAYAESLAKHNMNLLMLDIQNELNSSLALKLHQNFGVETKCFEWDVSKKETPEKIMEIVAGYECRLLIYNAYYGPVKHFHENSYNELDKYIEINCRNILRTTYLFTEKILKENRGGGIILMSSMSAFNGTKYITPYSSTKAFILNFAVGLYYEFKGKPIDILAVVPGPVKTPGYLLSNPSEPFFAPRPMNPAIVAEGALKRLSKKPMYIPGFKNRLNYFIISRLLPAKLRLHIVNKVMDKLYNNFSTTE